ncbi:hypothetical protein LNAOJCKE_0374 [Methylorubrum aminovorans]|uniref:Uncharacterized protein n=1 Tax=Methylorubrum aminovorans TaxID=269069 RepID=A0ABQ4UAI7_9HYPH|nr:hypothetical protein [Methylorubrum aminovorans]GJE63180.1 hypothetical protein LNAOJCKE_0374 [Methylorubrum aminovorans]
MKLELETKTTYSARLGHFYLSERPSEDDPQIAALEGMLKLFDPPFPGGSTDYREVWREAIVWVKENLPDTRICVVPELDRRGERRAFDIIATFASETDAVAFKTRWG